MVTEFSSAKSPWWRDYSIYPAATEPTDGAPSVRLDFYGGDWAPAAAHGRLRLGAGALVCRAAGRLEALRRVERPLA